MLGINKITVSDRRSPGSTQSYIIEVEYFLETGKDKYGQPALDLSRDTKLHACLARQNGKIANIIIEQSLSYPTYLGTELNPDIQKTDEGYRYPFYAKFQISHSETLSQYDLMLLSKQGVKSPKEEVTLTLFSSGALKIENDTNVSIEDKRTDFYDNIFNFDLFTTGNQQNNATVSELYISYGKDSSIKGMFFFDKQKFLIDNSEFGKILNNPDLPKSIQDEIMINSNINFLKITRRRLSYLRDFHNRPYRAYEDQVPITVATGYEKSGILTPNEGALLAEADDIDLSGIDYEKIITFNDRELSVGGTHQYSLDMRLDDGILKWLVSSLESLTLISSSIVRLDSSSLDVERVVNILFSLNSNLEIAEESLKKYLKNLTTQEGSRLLFVSYLRNLINKISNLIGRSGITSQINSSPSTIYLQSNYQTPSLVFTKEFSATANFDDARDFTYDYLGIPENSDIGASRIKAQQMKDRADREYGKLLKNLPEAGNFTNLSKNIFNDVFRLSPTNWSRLQLAYFNFEPNYFSYLSPVKVGKTSLTLSNTFNFNIMTSEHFKKKYDSNLTPQLSISYYLKSQGASIGSEFFRMDPPLRDASQSQTYLPSNSIFSDSDKINERPAVVENYKDGIEADTYSNASRTFASMFLRNEEGWTLSREDFNLANPTNILTSINAASIALTGIPAAQRDTLTEQLKVVREMPNQIRAIFASTSDQCVNQWLSPSMEGDYIYSPTTYYTIKQNYMNLVKIEYLAGFVNDENGISDIKNPIFKKLIDLSGSGKIICRASIYNDERFKIGVGFDKISYADEYFILDLTD